jgi:hypothetical protein
MCNVDEGGGSTTRARTHTHKKVLAKRGKKEICRMFVNKPIGAQFFLSIFIFANLYMFRAAMSPSTGDTTVFIRHFVLVILRG